LKFQIGSVVLEETPQGDPGPKSSEWHLVNIVQVKQIPGKGKKFITVRTSDRYSPATGVLWECDLVVRSISNTRYMLLKALVEDGGPFMTVSAHGNYRMYVTEGHPKKKDGEGEPPLRTDDDTDELNVAEWTLKLLEAYDGKA
jgi:hypothetical protein